MTLRSSNYLQLSIERDVEVIIRFYGPVTQAGIDKLILILYQSMKELMKKLVIWGVSR